MTKYQLQGQGKKHDEYNETHVLLGDWSTEYVGSSDEEATCDTYEEAENLLQHCMDAQNATREEYRIVEVEI